MVTGVGNNGRICDPGLKRGAAIVVAPPVQDIKSGRVGVFGINEKFYLTCVSTRY